MRDGPYIDIEIPELIHPGEPFEVAVVLESPTIASVLAVDVTFERVEMASNGPDEAPAMRRVSCFGATVAEDLVLEESGVHRARTRVPVPLDVPPTFDGRRLRIDWFVEVQVFVPGLPEARTRFPVEVAPRKEKKPAKQSLVARSPQIPFIEVQLADRAFAAGDRIDGAIIVGGLSGAGLEHVLVFLSAVERFTSTDERAASRSALSVIDRDLGEGRPMPFSLTIDRDARPSFEAAAEGASLTWEIEVHAQIPETPVLMFIVPIRIGLFS